MTFDSRWKNPTGKSPEQLHDAIVQIVKELRKGDYLPTVISNAEDIAYSNGTSGLTADDVQAALDEIEGRLDTAEATLTATPWRWSLLAQRTVTTDEVFTGLAGYSELRVYLAGVTTSSSAIRQLQASIDNGSNWLTSSGDYVSVDYLGDVANLTAIPFHASASTAARSGELLIRGASLTAPKTVLRTNGDQDQSTADERSMWVIPTANAVNALRVTATAGTPNGGTIYLYGR